MEVWKSLGVGALLLGTVAFLANFKGALDLLLWAAGLRHRLTTKATFSSDPYEGNVIVVANMSARPIMIDHWQLLWIAKRPALQFWKAQSADIEAEADYDWTGETIAAHDRSTWTFMEGTWFPARPERRRGQALTLRLYQPGTKRPRDLKIQR